MGPPSIVGGRQAGDRRLHRGRRCFNGAALNRGRKGGIRTTTPAGGQSFNGAALNRGRKAILPIAIPRAPAGFNGAALNRGRKGEKVRLSPRHHGASMGPPSIEGGRLVPSGDGPLLGASMGPPSIEGGRLPWVSLASGPSFCFNGAALNRGRKAVVAASTVRRKGWLQWGRPQSRAEGVARSCGRARNVGFNGAALNRGRKALPAKGSKSYGFSPTIARRAIPRGHFRSCAILLHFQTSFKPVLRLRNLGFTRKTGVQLHETPRASDTTPCITEHQPRSSFLHDGAHGRGVPIWSATTTPARQRDSRLVSQ